jgi:hypothetical protein
MWGKWEKLSSTAGRAILPRSAESAEIATAIDLVRRGLALLPRHVLERLLDASSPASEKSLHEAGGGRMVRRRSSAESKAMCARLIF